MEEEIGGGKNKFLFRYAIPTGATFSVIHGLAVVNDWYRTIPLIDVPMHFGWSLSLGFVVLWLIERYPGHIDLGKNFFVTVLTGLSLSALGGIIWEVLEFAYDFFGIDFGIPPVQFGLKDTIADLLVNMLGGLSVAIFAWLSYHKRRKSV